MPRLSCLAFVLSLCCAAQAFAEPPDLILHHGKIATVDKDFSLAEAIAIRGERIVLVGKNDDVLATKGNATRLVDLGGRLVLPGLIDSHTHPTGAAMHEFDHPIPDMESIADVLGYIKSRAEALPAGSWISVRQIFITRLREQRYPTRAELDAAAPKHPVIFSTGPDSMLSTLALKEAGIDKNYRPSGAGLVDKDPKTGEPTGLVRSVSVDAKSSSKSATGAEKLDRLEQLFRDYNAVGLTTVCDRDCSPGAIAQYAELREAQRLCVRMRISHDVDAGGRLAAVQEQIREIARHPLRKEDSLLQIIGIKCYLDGGMLTGSAYMRQPWGVSDIYLIRDPAYRGVLKIEPEKLHAIVKTTVETGMQFTAHSVGDGAVHTLIDAYEEANKTTPVRPTRPSITHCNFMSAEAIERMAKLGIVADIQPAWLYLDARTLKAQFGDDRLRYFQPLKTIFARGVIAGGGSDHMQKIGSLRSINPYNPFLGMATTLTRRAKWFEGQLHPEEALSREQAIRFYTMNNAYILSLDTQVGSLEKGKLADLIVVDRDLLTCPLEEVAATQVVTTYLGGKQIYPVPAPGEKQTIRCAIIGGMTDTGLWPEVARRFEEKTGHTVQVIAQGNKRIIVPLFEGGGIDLLTMHASDNVINLVADGYAENPQPWARNDLILVGPPSDPAGIRGEKDAVRALAKIVSSKSKLLMHASQGANEVLADLLAVGGIEPDLANIISLPIDRQREMMTQASQEKAYTLVGRIPFLNAKIARQDMEIMVQGDKRMRRPYVVIVALRETSDARHQAAQELARFLRSPETQAWLKEFGKGKLDDQPLFFPIELKRPQ